jgi:hypothetical protein
LATWSASNRDGKIGVETHHETPVNFFEIIGPVNRIKNWTIS